MALKVVSQVYRILCRPEVEHLVVMLGSKLVILRRILVPLKIRAGSFFSMSSSAQEADCEEPVAFMRCLLTRMTSPASCLCACVSLTSSVHISLSWTPFSLSFGWKPVSGKHVAMGLLSTACSWKNSQRGPTNCEDVGIPQFSTSEWKCKITATLENRTYSHEAASLCTAPEPPSGKGIQDHPAQVRRQFLSNFKDPPPSPSGDSSHMTRRSEMRLRPFPC